jgi:GAF domain-containing protein/HAMP domain-containing protein
MIDRFLRQLTVRRRIIGGFLALVLLLAISLPLVVTNYRFLGSRLQQVTEVDARIDRLLLLASTRIASSRVNLMRYVQDYAPSPHESLDDVDQATQFLEEAQMLITSPEQQTSVAAILEALTDYQTRIGEIEATRQEGPSQAAVRLQFEAYRLGNDISQRIELVVKDSEARVADTNQAVYAETQRRTIVLIAIWASAIAVGLLLALLVTRSIIRPIAELRRGAEALRAGYLETAIPVAGADELSVLAQAVNQLSTQLSESYLDLEQRVIDRTRELEHRSAYLQATADVGQAATSILETEQLIQQVVELVRERFGLYYVGLFLMDEAHEWAVLRAGTGQAGQAMLERGHRIKVGEGMIGWSVAHAQARVALEAGEDTVRLATAELPETRSEGAIPLRSRGQVLGALTVQHSQPGIFDPDTVAVLQTMADQVAVALDNARLFTESQSALDTARRAYGELSRQEWAELLRTSTDWGYRYQHKAVAAAQGGWSPMMEQAKQKGQIIRGNGSGESTLAVPIRLRDQVIGVLSFSKKESGQPWNDDEVTLLETLTDELSQVLESARLFQDTQRRAERERLIGEVTSHMRETLDLETVLKTAAAEMRKALGLEEFVVSLAMDEANSDPV